MKDSNIIEEKSKINKASSSTAKQLELDSEGLAHIMSVLTNLYSDPHSAVLREYVSNAIDSHKKAGKSDVPFEVELPTNAFPGNKNLVIIDHGTGMSAEEINNIYRKYGSSTKRTDNGQIGGFGLGGKSALSLAKSFSGVSVKDGREIEFEIYINDDDIPELDIISNEATDKENGVKIIIPIKSYLYEASTIRNIFNTIDVPVIINGALYTKNINNKDLYHAIPSIDGNDYTAVWYQADNSNNDYEIVNVVIGGVAYVIPSGLVSYLSDEAKNAHSVLERIARYKSFYINLPVASVRLTPSREALAFKERTVDTLSIMLPKALESLRNWLAIEINKINVETDVVDFIELNKALYTDSKKILWRGQEILLSVGTNRKLETKIPMVFGKTTSNQRYADYLTLMKKLVYSSSNTSIQLDKIKVVYMLDDENYHAKAILKSFITPMVNYTEYNQIILVSKETLDNKWFSDYPGFSTAVHYLEFIESVKAAKRELMRQNRMSSDGVVKTEKPKQMFAYPILVDSETSIGYTRISTKDSIFKEIADGKKKALYIQEGAQNSDYVIVPLNFNNQYGEIVSNKSRAPHFWKIYSEYISDDTVVFLLNRRQKLETFLRAVPTAKKFSNVRNNHYSNLVDSIGDLSYEVASVRLLDYSERSRIDRIVNAYTIYRNYGGKHVVEELESLISYQNRKDDSFRDAQLAHSDISLYVDSSIIVKKVKEDYLRNGGVMSMSKKYDFFEKITSAFVYTHELITENIDVFDVAVEKLM